MSAKDSFLNFFLNVIKYVDTVSCELTVILGMVGGRVAAGPASSRRRGLGDGKCSPSSGLGEGIWTN